MPLTFIPTPIGNLEDMTFRAVKAMQDAEIVFCEDTRVTKKLFDLLNQRFDAQISKKTFYSLHSHNEERILQNIELSIFEKNCVYMSDAGMPCISDPGALLVEYAQKNGIIYDVLPGASAAVTAYAASGFLDTKFVFHGFLPHKSSARIEELRKLQSSKHPVIFYEAPHRIEQFAKELCGIDKNATVFAAKELTKMHQKYITISAAKFEQILKTVSTKGEWVVIVLFSAQESGFIALSLDEVLELDLPKKQAAKLIAKITGENPKNVYEELIKKDS